MRQNDTRQRILCTLKLMYVAGQSAKGDFVLVLAKRGASNYDHVLGTVYLKSSLLTARHLSPSRNISEYDLTA